MSRKSTLLWQQYDEEKQQAEPEPVAEPDEPVADPEPEPVETVEAGTRTAAIHPDRALKPQ